MNVGAVVDTLKRIAEKFPDRVAQAIYQEAQIEMTESKRRCPVADPKWYKEQGYGEYQGTPGRLRGTGMVQQPERSGNNISVALTYGTDYAVYVHENLDAFHPNGQAKFLESVLDESRPYMADRIAKRVDLNRMKV